MTGPVYNASQGRITLPVVDAEYFADLYAALTGQRAAFDRATAHLERPTPAQMRMVAR